MSRRLDPALLALSLLLAACSQPDVETVVSITPGEGAESPSAAVDELVRAMNEPDFADASRLAMPAQAALAALAEGAGFDDVADALRRGDEEVAANFWAGFAQGAGDFLSGTVTTADEGPVTLRDIDFWAVEVLPTDGGTRMIMVREDVGYRVDLFASFGGGLADKMAAPVERLLTTQTDDARFILYRLQDIVPSLLVAAELPGTSSAVSQQILSLVELITRVG